MSTKIVSAKTVLVLDAKTPNLRAIKLLTPEGGSSQARLRRSKAFEEDGKRRSAARLVNGRHPPRRRQQGAWPFRLDGFRPTRAQAR